MKKITSILVALLMFATMIVPFSAFASTGNTTATGSTNGRADIIVKVYDKIFGNEITTYSPGQAVTVKVLSNFTGFTTEPLNSYQLLMPNGEYFSYSGMAERTAIGSTYNPNTAIWGNTSYTLDTTQSLYGYVTASNRADFKVLFKTPLPTVSSFPLVLGTFNAVISNDATGELTFDVAYSSTASSSTYFAKSTMLSGANIYKWSSAPAVLTKYVAQSSNANLTALTANGTSVLASGSSINVASDVSSVNIVATKEDSTATVTGDGTKSLNYGPNQFTVTVKAQAGNTNDYTFTVNRAYPALGATVTFKGKDMTGSKYGVVLNNTQYTGSTEFKAYALDAVYGWVLVKSYGTETTFDINIENPTDPLKIEVLTSVDGTPTGIPTYSKNLTELGQLDIASNAGLNAAGYTVGESIELTTSAVLPSGLSAANYEIYFGDSGKSFKGSTADGLTKFTATAKKPGTYSVSVRYYDPAKEANVIEKTFKYTVIPAQDTNLPIFGGKLNVTVNGNNVKANLPSISSAAGVSYKYRFVSPVVGDKYNFAGDTGVISKPGVYYAFADAYLGTTLADTAYSTVKVARTVNPVSISGISVNNVNGTYTFTANATNATEYMFIRRDETGYRTVQMWSSSNEWTWTPARGGFYEIYAYAKRTGVAGEIDAGSYEAVASTTIGSKNEALAVPTPNFSTVNGITTISIAAADKVAGYSYAFEIYDPISNKNIFSGYSTDASYNFVPLKANRAYSITTLVKSTTNNSGAYDNKATITGKTFN